MIKRKGNNVSVRKEKNIIIEVLSGENRRKIAMSVNGLKKNHIRIIEK